MTIITMMTTPASLRAALQPVSSAFHADLSGVKCAFSASDALAYETSVRAKAPESGIAPATRQYGKRRPHRSRFSLHSPTGQV